MTPPAGESHTVTLSDVYLALLELKADVLVLKSRDTELDISDHEQRLRLLERWVWGAAAVSGVAAVVLSQVVGALLK